MMHKRIAIPLLTAGLVALGACRADQEALDEGVQLDAPEEIENAPLVDTVGAEGLDFNPPPDTLVVPDTVGAPGAAEPM